MKRIIQLTGFYIVVLLFAACSEDVEPKPLTYSKVFTGTSQKTWVVSAIQWTGEGESDINYSLQACIADDQYVFYANADRQYQVTNGSRKCASDEADVLLDDTWSFVNATATLTIVLPFLSDSRLPFFVRSVTDTEMELEIFIDQDNRYSYRITLSTVDE